MKTLLESALAKLSAGRVLVVGDVAIDEMVYGHSARLSREAPVLILNHDHTDHRLGGAGNAVHNVAALGAARASLLTVCGVDDSAKVVSRLLDEAGVEHADGLLADPMRPTSTKTRISGIANHSVTQQIVRIDRESKAPIPPDVEARVVARIAAMAGEFDALLLSDYGLGLVTPAVIEACRQAAQRHGLVWAVDSQKPLSPFYGATILTPNQPEAEQTLGFVLDTPERVMEGGQRLLQMTQAQAVLITRGSEGMSLFEATGNVTHIPVFNKSEVFDVTGAGDTVVAMVTLAIATGTPMPIAAVLGNLAASRVVRRFGVSTTDIAELTATLPELLPQLEPLKAVCTVG